MSAAIVSLIGPRCSGKTTLGWRFAETRGWSFSDLDAELLRLFNAGRAAGEPVLYQAGEVLARLGESEFRDLEQRALAEVLERDGPRVLATGGGVVEREANVRALRASTRCVWLKVEPAILRARMLADPALRPSLTGARPEDEIEALLARRNPLYEATSHFTLTPDPDDVEGAVRALEAWLLSAG